MSDTALPAALALSEEDAAALLETCDPALRPCLEAGLGDLKALRANCLEAGIPAQIGASAGSCGGGKCSPKAQLWVREEDVPRVQALLRQRWEDEVRALGVEPVRLNDAQGEGAADGELACPACGTAAPLVEGACSDCGLQLE